MRDLDEERLTHLESLKYFKEEVLCVGPIATGLVDLAEKFGADTRTYNNTPVGRHIDAIVKNREKVFQYIEEKLGEPGKSLVATRLKPLWESYAEFHELSKKTHLDAAERATAIALCASFPKLFRTLYPPCPDPDNCKCPHPHKGVPVKLHIIERHVPRLFAQSSWGKWNEQTIEAAHALGNATNRRFASVRGAVARLEATHRALEVMKHYADSHDALRASRKRARRTT